MKTKRTSPAKKEYRVVADCNSLVCKTIMATSPEEAYRIAEENDDAWESASGSDDGEYRLHQEVFDLKTEEFIPVHGLPVTQCKTCGSEIVATINDSAFRDGECNGCEYERYKTQPKLLSALELLDGCVRMGSMGKAYAGSDTEQIVKRVLNQANGKAQ